MAWAKKNPDRIKAHLKNYSISDHGKAQIRKTRKSYFSDPVVQERIQKTYQKWYAKNGAAKNARNRTEEANAKNRQRYREGMKDIQYHLQKVLRSRLKNAVRNGFKGGSAVRQLGCSIKELKIHLESKFSNNMSWDNYGKIWHIDHIKPLAAFDLTAPEHVAIACHYTNLQPLLKEDNLSKRDKIMAAFQLPLPFGASYAL